jgi:phage terminase small subunit
VSRHRNPAGVRELHHSRTRPHHVDRVPEDDPAAVQEPVEIEAPASLIEAEKVYWAQFAPLLTSAKVLTPADVETLADYCRACVAVDDRSARLRIAYAAKVVDNQTVRQLDASLRGWIERKTKLAGELGLTAIARTRVAWTGHHQRPPAASPAKPQSTLARLQQEASVLRRVK